jgi:hypothetical protein
MSAVFDKKYKVCHNLNGSADKKNNPMLSNSAAPGMDRQHDCYAAREANFPHQRIARLELNAYIYGE